MTGTINLFALEHDDQKAIIRKLTALSGARFIQTCRDAKDLVDETRPVWPLAHEWVESPRANSLQARYFVVNEHNRFRLKSDKPGPQFCVRIPDWEIVFLLIWPDAPADQ